MGTIRAQQTDNAQEAIDDAGDVVTNAPGTGEPEDLAVFVVDNANAIIQLGAAVQRVELLLQRLIDQRDGGQLGVT